MRSVFTKTAEHRIADSACSLSLSELPGLIYKHTGFDYAFAATDKGYFLKPTFRNMPYRNSFVPEIDVTVSRNDTETILHMSGRPIKPIRIFWGRWFGFLLLMQVFLLVFALSSEAALSFQFFIPIILCVFAFLLCKIATGHAFKSVVEAIRKEIG